MIKEEGDSMNFFDHLKELRKKLLFSIVFFILSFIICFYFSKQLFVFLAKPLTDILGDEDHLGDMHYKKLF